MILAIFIIPLAFGTKPEFQLRIGFLRPAAHGAFMPGDSGGLFHFPLKFLSAPGLPGRHMNLPSAGYEKYNKISYTIEKLGRIKYNITVKMEKNGRESKRQA